MEKIDFVITWVDGNDKKWQKEKQKYQPQKDNDARDIRYRDYDLLKYWFRSIEKNAPWVNKIYFITYGHIPEWLNTKNEKLVIVKHADFIPKKYLPTFNSCTIELNMHRIKNLSKNFVYFNDDMFILKKTSPSDFFIKDLPRDYAILSAIIPTGKDKFEHRLVNNTNFINKHFNIKKVVKKNPLKWFNFKYGLSQFRTLFMLGYSNTSCLKFSHAPVSYNKENFQKIWSMEPELLDLSCVDKFRAFYGVNHWIIQDYQKLTGNFIPVRQNRGKFYALSDNIPDILKEITECKHKFVCINDSDNVHDFEKIKSELHEAFETNFSKKSRFER